MNIRRLRRLLAEATPTPWPDWPVDEDGETDLSKYPETIPPHWDYYLTSQDAELIIAAINALPELLRLAEESGAR